MNIDATVARLETAFSRIQQERMGDVPILNPSLRVQAVGFRPWGGGCCGVLVTPWFMNLLVFPGSSPPPADIPVGSTVTHAFPAGRFTFIVAHEPEVGFYHGASLFSPMFEFIDQDSAIATAESILAALFTQPDVRQGDESTPVPHRPQPKTVSRRGLIQLFTGTSR